MAELDWQFVDADMSANIRWATGISEQGWLNPHPFHPFTDWMAAVAPYEDWVHWWGGDVIYQQSPLYAYLLSIFITNLSSARIFQGICGLATCLLLWGFASRAWGPTTGVITLLLGVAYAPFHAYYWPFLRDGLGWTITAGLLLGLSTLSAADWFSRRARGLAIVVGLLLGLGLLARESYYLMIPVVVSALTITGVRRRSLSPPFVVLVTTLMTITPLIVRNHLVGAPLLSSSNRFAETFIHGNANGAHPYLTSVNPAEVVKILSSSNGSSIRVIDETIKTHPDGYAGWIRLELKKFQSLFDPYESPDNISFYFVEKFSPVVRFGLKYWMVLVPGIIGFTMLCGTHGSKGGWLAIMLPILLLSLMVGTPVSRYRQSLMVILLPCSAFCITKVTEWFRQRELRKAGYAVLGIAAGFLAVLGPLSVHPRSLYERPQEYGYAAEYFMLRGMDREAAIYRAEALRITRVSEQTGH